MDEYKKNHILNSEQLEVFGRFKTLSPDDIEMIFDSDMLKTPKVS